MPELKHHIHLHFIVLIWGFTAILGKLISIPAVEIVFYRTLIATILLGIFIFLIRKQYFYIPLSDMLKIGATGVLISLHWILFFAAAQISASVCLAGIATTTLWTSLLEPLICQKKVRAFEIILGLIIILGLYVVFVFEFSRVEALLMAVGSAFIGALFTVINVRFIQKHNHYTITFYEMLGAFLGVVLFLPFYPYLFPMEGLPRTIALIPNSQDWIYLLILGGFCTFYAYSASVKLMTRFSAFAINLTVNLEPVYGIILAFLLFGESERMNIGFYLGTAVILVAVLSYPFLDKHVATFSKSLIKLALVKK